MLFKQLNPTLLNYVRHSSKRITINHVKMFTLILRLFENYPSRDKEERRACAIHPILMETV